MAFKMTKSEKTRITTLLAKMENARDKVDLAVTTFNSKVSELEAPVTKAIDTLNELQAEIYGVMEDIHNERSGEFDDKSERWQESEAAEDAQSWLSSIEYFKDLFGEELEAPETQMEIDLSAIDESINAEIPE